MKKNSTSIIIPTYNRGEILLKCLDAIEHQLPRRSHGKIAGHRTELNQLEVLIVNDGSTDNTLELLEKNRTRWNFALQILTQKNSGQGIARNRAIAKAQGEIIFFIGDDIILDSNCVAEHLAMHDKFSAQNHAVLGFIDWSREIKVTPFMQWLVHGSNILGKFGGHQFAYEKLEGRNYADYNFFYTSNISLKKSLLEKENFDEDFGTYGWEDIELGYRLSKKYDLKIHYNHKAIGYHFHEIDEKTLAPRMRMIGESAYIIDRKHPELKKVPGFKKKLLLQILSNPLNLGFLKILKLSGLKIFANFYYYALSKKYFLEGLNKPAGLKAQSSTKNRRAL